MEDSYIFFDIESSNSVGGDGHICSFGYVICDRNFRIMQKEDIVMNPRSDFEPHLFSPASKCRLAYTREYFRSQPDFGFYYEKIRELLTFPGRRAIGFAVENDIDFIVCACSHFNKPQFEFTAYDSRAIADRMNSCNKGLSSWLEFYGINTDGLVAHRSCDDAEMTMLLVQKMCMAKKMHLNEFLAFNFFALRSVQQDIERRNIRAYKKETDEKIRVLYGKKNPSPVTRRLSGKYVLCLSKKRDCRQKLELFRLIYDNGGVLASRITGNCTYVMEDNGSKADWMNLPKFKDVRFVHISDIFRELEMEPWPFKKMSWEGESLDGIF